MNWKKNKPLSLLYVTLAYAAAYSAGALSLSLLRAAAPPLLNMFIATTLATVVIWVFNLFVNNASVYDPYWSVQPPFIIAGFFWIYRPAFQLSQLLIFVPLLFWAIRLTLNWASGFDNLEWEDWRYTEIKKRTGKWGHIAIFFAVMYLPTVLVFLGTIPAWVTLNTAALYPFWPALGGAIITFGTLLELIADLQMKRYKKRADKSPYINEGLWKISRHPNYLGEILVWIGLFVGSLQTVTWASVPGVIAIILLFIFVSIPMMEQHVSSTRPQYKTYQETVGALIPGIGKQQARDA